MERVTRAGRRDSYRPRTDPAFSRWVEVPSPLGPLRLTAHQDGLAGLYLRDHSFGPEAFPEETEQPRDPLLREAAQQLKAYFAGTLKRFDLPLAPAGTPFQHRVWRALLAIPFGETRSYNALARQVGVATGFRAVGAANGKNPIAMIIPCHRVVGADGGLVGYGGGLERKRWLLAHEERVAGVTLS
jgi:methylated-DNA-[protein]-cysteine S-methyltransferase